MSQVQASLRNSFRKEVFTERFISSTDCFPTIYLTPKFRFLSKIVIKMPFGVPYFIICRLVHSSFSAVRVESPWDLGDFSATIWTRVSVAVCLFVVITTFHSSNMAGAAKTHSTQSHYC